MADILDVSVGTSWVDIYNETGITVGNPLEIMNKGSQYIFLTEKSTEPTVDNEGKLLTTVSANYPTAKVLSGSDRIWARCSSNLGTTLAVQEST